MDITTAKILTDAGYGKLQSEVDSDLQHEILSFNPFKNYVNPKSNNSLSSLNTQQNTHNINNSFVNILKQNQNSAYNKDVAKPYVMNPPSADVPTPLPPSAQGEGNVMNPPSAQGEGNVMNPPSLAEGGLGGGYKHSQTQIKNIVLSSNPNFKPDIESTFNNDANNDVSANEKSQQKNSINRLNNIIDTLKFNDYTGISNISRQYKGLENNTRSFENFKVANNARLEFMQKMRENLQDKEDTEEIKTQIDKTLSTHNILEKIAHSLEIEKQKHGRDSKQYKDLVEKYHNINPIAKEYNITDYASLAKYYNSQRVNIDSNKNTQDANTQENIHSNTQDSQNTYNSIESMVKSAREVMSNLNKKDGLALNEKGIIEGMAGATKHIFSNIAGDYNVGAYNQKNQQLLHDKNLTGDSILTLLKNNGLHNFLESNKDVDKDKLATYIDSDILSRGTLQKLSNVAGSISETIREAINPKEETFNQFFSMGDSYFATDKATSKQWEEYKNATRDYLRADANNKDVLYQRMQNQLARVENAWNEAPAKLLANSKLIEFASSVKNEHDVGRVWNVLRDKNTNIELKQSYLNDMMSILKSNKNFQDIASMNFTREGDLIAIDNNGKAYSLNTGIMTDIINAVAHSKAEIVGGLAGSVAGAKVGLRAGKNPISALAGAAVGGALGTVAGSLTDTQLNKIVTGYINKDAGFKKALEGGVISLSADGLVFAGGKTISFIANSNITQKAKSLYENARNYIAGENLQSTQALLARTLLNNEDRANLQEIAMQRVFEKTYHSSSDKSLQKTIYNDLRKQGLTRRQAGAKFKEYEDVLQNMNNNLLETRMQDIIKGMNKYEHVSFDSNRPLMGLLQDVLENKAIRAERDKFLKVAMNHPQLSNVIVSIANKNPAIASNLSQFITSRAQRVGNAISFENKLNKQGFSDAINAYEKDLKKEYGRIENNLIQALENSNFSHTTAYIVDTLENLKNSLPRVEHKGIINDLQAFSAKTQNINDLFTLRKAVNEELRSKELKKPSVEALRSINETIDTHIREALEILKKDANSQQVNIETDKLFKQYKDINKEYADFKDLTKSDFYSKTLKNNKEISEEKFAKEILQAAKKAKTNKSLLSNEALKRIHSKMPTYLQAQAISEAINQHTKHIKGNNKAIFWEGLIKDLAAIKPNISDSELVAKIELLEDMKSFYHNDLAIAKAISNATGEKPQSYLSNSFYGKMQMYYYNTLYRFTGRFNFSEKSAFLAFENHLRNALKYSRSTKELNETLIKKLEKDSVNNAREDSIQESKVILSALKDFNKKFNTTTYKNYEEAKNIYSQEIASEKQDDLLVSTAISYKEQILQKFRGEDEFSLFLKAEAEKDKLESAKLASSAYNKDVAKPNVMQDAPTPLPPSAQGEGNVMNPPSLAKGGLGGGYKHSQTTQNLNQDKKTQDKKENIKQNIEQKELDNKDLITPLHNQKIKELETLASQIENLYTNKSL